jgi:UDP-N-acetylglucosamine--N-acetylmuramyl-(pentapeptide) pyrophosphoryl-undecaprenol N-acetylglucosamine transferase
MDKRRLDKRILITGGGSGGHISAALSIISSLEEKYILDDKSFLYVGGDLGMEGEETGNSMEQKLMKDKPFNCKYIRPGKLQRSFSLNTIRLLFRTFLGIWDSYKIIKDFRPDIVISTGGFVTVHVCLVAKLFKSKIYLHEQTSTVGLTNSLVGKISEKVFISFESSKQYFKKGKTLLTGNLVKADIFNTKGQGKLAETIRKMKEKQSQYPIIYISGGGLGSHLINQTVKEALPLLLQKYQIVLQTGENKVFNDYQAIQTIKESLSPEMQSRFQPVTYIQGNNIGYLLNSIDLFVGRAGANTVYEMGVLQIPSIFIPIPWVTHNEQQKNAEVLANLGLAEIVQEGELTSACLALRIEKFLSRQLDINREELKRIFKTDANKLILKNIGL